MHKYKILVLSILWILPVHMNAQTNWHLGFGINDTHVALNPRFNSGCFIVNDNHFFASIRPEFILNEKFSFSSELQYSQKGIIFFNLNTPYYDSHRFSYLEFLPQMEFKFFPFLGFYGGFGIALKLNERYHRDDLWFISNQNLTKKIDSNYFFGVRLRLFKKLTLNTHLAVGFGDFLNVEFTNFEGNVIAVRQQMFNFQVGAAYQIF